MDRLKLRWWACLPVAAALWLVFVVALLPGVAEYDTVQQYRQLLTGHYDDWHPPIMARLWSLFAWGWPGQASMFVLQAALYWLGLGLIGATLARVGRPLAGWLALLVGLWPPYLAAETLVLKDMQMASALLAACGVVAWWRLRGLRLPGWALAASLVLIGYATLVRANAAFATVPLVVALYRNWRWRHWGRRVLLIGAGTLAVLAVSPTINNGLLGARPRHIQQALPIFDLAGIEDRVGPGAVPVLPAGDWNRIAAAHCYTPILWDSFDETGRCGFVATRFADPATLGALYSAWTHALAAHPAAYAAHRLAHWNATMRWWVPWHFPLTVPQAGSEANDLGLDSPNASVAIPLDALGGWLADSPLGAPIVALALAIALLAVARPAEGPAAAMAVALALSAAAMEASFLPVSIASDWRYHFWSMLAVTLAALLVATRPPPRRATAIALAGVLLVAATAQVARIVLPAIGDNYSDAIGAGSEQD